jgi:hypothetical protein
MFACKLCKQDPKPVKAHIIPRRFWEPDPIEPLRMLTNIKGQHMKRSRIGIYDSTIVCEAC